MSDKSGLGAHAVPRDPRRDMSGLAFLRGLLDGTLDAPPFSATSRIRPVSVDFGRVTFEGEPKGDFYNPMGTVHGGWIATLLDTAMACAVHSSLKPGEAFTSVEMKITFVRHVREDTGVLRCEGIVLHSGGRIASAEGKVLDAAGNLVAHGTETCMITRLSRA